MVLALASAPVASAEDGHKSSYSQFGGNLLTGGNAPYLDLSQSPSPLGGLSVSGFLNNSTGMWANSSALRSFGRSSGEHHGSNSLAVERNWIQVDTNYVLDGNNRFFLRFWGVYEPSYPWESRDLLGPGGQYDRSAPDFYNRYDVRDAFWKNTTGPLTTFFGRQIVTWGESLAFRVGDVINPQDLSWNFGFANLEQSRLPLWMVHPILNLPELKPFEGNFIEGVWTPAWQPLYTQRRLSGRTLRRPARRGRRGKSASSRWRPVRYLSVSLHDSRNHSAGTTGGISAGHRACRSERHLPTTLQHLG